jgi:gamma-glutamyltranspeptidase/glutathione hydrolase
LKAYRPVIRTPVRGTYRGHDIISMPLPSSGGVVLVEMLNVLEGFPLREWGPRSADTLHVMVEAMKRGYADRARHLGDPATADMPMQRLLSKEYAARLRGSIDMARATPASEVADLSPVRREGQNTTHYSVVDRSGNAVSNTYTLNFSYGLAKVADGTGVILNNELDDFTAAVGASNYYGLVGYEANLPGPGKRPLSSMTPTIVEDAKGNVLMLVGAAGGPRIITAVWQTLSNVIDFKQAAANAVANPRVHHQHLPDVLRLEALAVTKPVEQQLIEAGHKTDWSWEKREFGAVNAIVKTAAGYEGAADPRGGGAAAGD